MLPPCHRQPTRAAAFRIGRIPLQHAFTTSKKEGQRRRGNGRAPLAYSEHPLQADGGKPLRLLARKGTHSAVWHGSDIQQLHQLSLDIVTTPAVLLALATF